MSLNYFEIIWIRADPNVSPLSHSFLGSTLPARQATCTHRGLVTVGHASPASQSPGPPSFSTPIFKMRRSLPCSPPSLSHSSTHPNPCEAHHRLLHNSLLPFVNIAARFRRQGSRGWSRRRRWPPHFSERHLGLFPADSVKTHLPLHFPVLRVSTTATTVHWSIATASKCHRTQPPLPPHRSPAIQVSLGPQDLAHTCSPWPRWAHAATRATPHHRCGRWQSRRP
jgi:hypothetical protein